MPNRFWVEYQRWSVFWYSRKKRKWVRKRFHEDLHAALKFLVENVDSKPGICLHSDNHAYPPPRHITHHEREHWEIVKRRGKRYKRRVFTEVNLMNDYNRKGIWWCGYCIALRRFKLVETVEGPQMYCPVCGVSHRMLRKHNPQAALIEYRKRQQRTPRAKPRRRKRR